MVGNNERTKPLTPLASLLMNKICNFMSDYIPNDIGYKRKLSDEWIVGVDELGTYLQFSKSNKNTVIIRLLCSSSKLPQNTLLIREFLPENHQRLAFCPDFMRFAKAVPEDRKISEDELLNYLILASQNLNKQ